MLDLGIVLPTRNSISLLPEHLHSMADCLRWTREIVVVDSESTDGTWDYLRSHLRHPCCDFLQHPPGLYASWNFGIRRIRARYVYISTVGDRIQAEGLRCLVEAIQSQDAGFWVSPPCFQFLEGRSASRAHWPIHDLIQDLALAAPVMLDMPTQLFYSCYYALRDLSSLLGSSASNVYRTQLLKEYPFPEDYGTAGDVVWGLQNVLHARMGVWPQECSQFLWHAPAGRNTPALTGVLWKRLWELARLQWEEALKVNARCRHLNSLFPWQSFFNTLNNWRQARWRLQACRDKAWPWIFQWPAWRARYACHRYDRQLQQLKQRFIKLRQIS